MGDKLIRISNAKEIKPGDALEGGSLVFKSVLPSRRAEFTRYGQPYRLGFVAGLAVVRDDVGLYDTQTQSFVSPGTFIRPKNGSSCIYRGIGRYVREAGPDSDTSVIASSGGGDRVAADPAKYAPRYEVRPVTEPVTEAATPVPVAAAPYRLIHAETGEPVMAGEILSGGSNIRYQMCGLTGPGESRPAGYIKTLRQPDGEPATYSGTFGDARVIRDDYEAVLNGQALTPGDKLPDGRTYRGVSRSGERIVTSPPVIVGQYGAKPVGGMTLRIKGTLLYRADGTEVTTGSALTSPLGSPVTVKGIRENGGIPMVECEYANGEAIEFTARNLGLLTAKPAEPANPEVPGRYQGYPVFTSARGSVLLLNNNTGKLVTPGTKLTSNLTGNEYIVTGQGSRDGLLADGNSDDAVDAASLGVTVIELGQPTGLAQADGTPLLTGDVLPYYQTEYLVTRVYPASLTGDLVTRADPQRLITGSLAALGVTRSTAAVPADEQAAFSNLTGLQVREGDYLSLPGLVADDAYFTFAGIEDGKVRVTDPSGALSLRDPADFGLTIGQDGTRLARARRFLEAVVATITDNDQATAKTETKIRDNTTAISELQDAQETLREQLTALNRAAQRLAKYKEQADRDVQALGG